MEDGKNWSLFFDMEDSWDHKPRFFLGGGWGGGVIVPKVNSGEWPLRGDNLATPENQAEYRMTFFSSYGNRQPVGKIYEIFK